MSSEHMGARGRGSVLGLGIDRISRSEASELVCGWAASRSSRAVFAANVHMTMEAVDDPAFRRVMDAADLVVADGLPLVWVLRARGFADAHHVRGQELVLAVCKEAQARGIGIGMYGTTDEVLQKAAGNLRRVFPRLRIVFSLAPPFRALSPEEDRDIIEAIDRSGAQVLLVAIGCPKQEKWIAAHRGRVQAVMIGAGAAIDMIGGQQPVAPRWMQSSGLEWVFRLASDPVRLWRRYAKHNIRFVALVLAETVSAALRAKRSGSTRDERG
jgi:N-acetylglucosaminyldiphosphoundecaprenol N-acetyl-beta-D-mannosaminyltransferase